MTQPTLLPTVVPRQAGPVVTPTGTDAGNRISVVVPVHRVEQYIAPSMASLAAQRLRPSEVILVDDRGGDHSIAIAAEVLDDLGLPHRVVVHEVNRMTGAARNSGLAAATGDWIWFFDPDDRSDPGFCADLLAAAHRHDAQVVVCRTARVDEGGRELEIIEPSYPEEVVTGPEAARRLLDNRLRGYSCNKLFRRELLGQDPFDVGRRYEDFLPVFSALLAAQRVALVDAPLYRYLEHSQGQSAAFGRHTLDLLSVIDDVAAAITAAGLAQAWHHDQLNYRYVNGILPIVNLALRADHAGLRTPESVAALRAARAATRPGELWHLITGPRWRTGLSGALVKYTPALYSAVLKWR